MLTLDLLRHGELEGGVKYRGLVDDPLTERGRLEMDRVWQKLAGRVDGIISSPLSRCAGPARQWASDAGIECAIDPRITELHYGDWEGKTAAEIEAAYPGMLGRWRRDPTGMRPPNGESPEELRARVRDLFDELKARTSGRHLLIVAHSGSLRMLLAVALGASIAATRRFSMPYACWSRITLRQGMPVLAFHQRQPDAGTAFAEAKA